MARYTLPYGAFIKRLDEVNILRKAALYKERSDAVRHSDEVGAMCRGAVVLLSSHVEAYVREVGELALEKLYLKSIDRDRLSPMFFYHISKDILDEMKETSDPLKIAEKLFNFLESDSRYWSRSGPFDIQIPSDRFNKGFSNPAFKKIRGYFNRFGYTSYQKDFYRVLKAQAIVVHNAIDHMVDTRNNIAHGDPTATKTPADLKTMLDNVVVFCRVTDQVFSSWCKDNICTIR